MRERKSARTADRASVPPADATDAGTGGGDRGSRTGDRGLGTGDRGTGDRGMGDRGTDASGTTCMGSAGLGGNASTRRDGSLLSARAASGRPSDSWRDSFSRLGTARSRFD
jgi:hypothetical protein